MGEDPEVGAVVEVLRLTKSFGDVRAVAGIDLRIGRGEVFALLGPNGAGKTTTVEILEGYQRRDGGEVTVLGLDPARDRIALKKRIGIVLQTTAVDRYLTVAETMAMYAGYYSRPLSVDAVIELAGLTRVRGTRVIRLSGGQQRRLDVAVALIGDPELLFLDEPTTGFDPSARHEAWEVVRNLATLGKTVLLTTHYMDEAQQLADRVAVIVAGRIVAQGTPDTLAGRDTANPRISYRLPPGVTPPPGMGAADNTGAVQFAPADLTPALHRLTGWAIDNGVTLDDLRILRPSLEEVYLQLTSDGVTTTTTDPTDRNRPAGSGSTEPRTSR
ncbi:MAG TPA: ABC transporter ATP-binding protein [Microlunatus sp.]|nr:ABC transporter ATP-binding protein [Microlunatus sp.]